MSYSYTTTETKTFTVTHARHMAVKVATDLKRMQRFYGFPSDQGIQNFEKEVTALLKGGYLGTIWYGFRRDGNWVEPTLKYTAQELAGASANDDDPGRIRPGKNKDGASFYSFLEYNSAWINLTHEERQKFEESLPFQRSAGAVPNVNGYLEDDRVYSAGGRALNRSSVRNI